MQNRTSSSARYALFLIYLAAMSYIGLELMRWQGPFLFVAYFSAFFAYFWLCKFQDRSENVLFILGLVARGSLLFALPNLSDDFYRFIWDGELLKAGFNPYSYLPKEALDLHVKRLNPELFAQLNSPGYYSVYPPLNQLIFWISSSLGSSLLGQVNTIRVFLITADVASYFLLKRLSNNRSIPHWYFLNPLVILEFTGNVHFEGLVIVFLLLTLWLLTNQRHAYAGMMLGLAAGVKLIPLIFLPFLAWRYRWWKGIIISICTLLIFIGALWPMLGEGEEVLSSLSLYFKSFEFNASVYFIFRQIGFWTKDYNVIALLGTKLAVVTLVLVLFWAVWGNYRNKSVSEGLLVTLFIYLSLGTTIHPWYVVSLIPLGLLAGFYFPVLWSLLIFATYTGYTKLGYHPDYRIIAAEYLILWAFILIELKNRNEKVLAD